MCKETYKILSIHGWMDQNVPRQSIFDLFQETSQKRQIENNRRNFNGHDISIVESASE